jgi:hypothetical protein
LPARGGPRRGNAAGWLGVYLDGNLVPGDDLGAVTLTDALNQGSPLLNLLCRGEWRLGGHRS